MYEIDVYVLDLVVLVGYMCIFSLVFVSYYQGCLLNIYFLLLLKYSGLYIYCQVLENGDEEYGILVYFVIDELDGGLVILQVKVLVFVGDSEEEIMVWVQVQEYVIYLLVISWFVDGCLCMVGNYVWLDE